jgi:Tfp pilus assembly protein PilV
MSSVVRQVEHSLTAEGDSRGQLLIEILIALALMGIIAVVFIGAMYTALQSARIADERSIALTLATSEIEYVKQQPYSDSDWAYTIDTAGSYAAPGMAPTWWGSGQPPALSGVDFAGYSVSMSGTSIDLDGDGANDEGIRRLTATTLHNGTAVLTLKNYELKR